MEETHLDDVDLLSAVVPHFKLLAVTFDVLCDPHRAHLNATHTHTHIEIVTPSFKAFTSDAKVVSMCQLLEKVKKTNRQTKKTIKTLSEKRSYYLGTNGKKNKTDDRMIKKKGF